MRTRIYVTDASSIDEVGRAHGAAFATARPATTGIVTQLLDPRWLVEIEAEAVILHHVKQIFPPSITGKGSIGTGTGQVSVLDHAFGKSDPYTLGVEEEYMLLDPETWDLVQHIDSVLAAAADGDHEDRIHAELMQSVLEVTTPVCRTAGDVLKSLAQLRGYVAEIARAEGCRFGSAGTHPFSLFERQRITARDRYRQLVDQLQYVARRELIFGMHMHVAVDDPEKAIQVMNGLLVHLPQMLALSATSPFWRGEPTGLSSSRQMVFAAFPRSGPPPRFRDYTDFAEVVGQLERTGCIADYTHIWWDIRPHPRLGTIEMRVCDAVTRLEDVVAITAFFQAIVKMYCELYEAGKEIPSWHRMLTTENKWLAARYGLEAPGHGPRDGPPQPRPGRAADPPNTPGRRAARTRARLRARARGRARDPRARQRLRPPATGLEREPRHRRGRARDLDRDGRGRSGGDTRRRYLNVRSLPAGE